jgi:cell division protein FtsQ
MMVLKRSVQLTILVLLAASVKFGWNYLQSGGIFPISVVKVEADYTHLSQEELQAAISSDLPASFWTVDILSLENRLQAIAWVESVDIQKVWPETLKVRVNEKKLLARWGKDGLLSDKEEIFYPESQNLPNGFDQFPILYGPTEQVKNVVKQYNILQEMLSNKGMTIKMLYMSQSGAWSIRLTNGTMLLLGRDEPVKRLARFLHAYDSIFMNQPDDGQIHFARRVDLRYPHGMAISWAVEPMNKNKDSSEDK